MNTSAHLSGQHIVGAPHATETPHKAISGFEDSCGPKSLEIGSTSAVSGRDVLIKRASARNHSVIKKGGVNTSDNPEALPMSQNSGRGTHPTFRLRDRSKIQSYVGKQKDQSEDDDASDDDLQDQDDQDDDDDL